jgi:hypothetical protein
MSTATAGVLSVSITAKDLASPALAKLSANSLRVASNLSRLSDRVGGLGSLNRLASGARNVAQSFQSIAPPLAALTAAGTLAGVVNLAARFAAFGAELGRTSQRVQTSAADLYTLQGAARLSGSSAEAMTQSMEGLRDALLDAVSGRDMNAAMYFDQLGIKMRDASTGGARLARDVLPEIADQIARISNPGLQLRVMRAFRIPDSALPFMRRGAAGLREYQREAARFGVFSDAAVEAAGRFEFAQSKLDLAGRGLSNTLMERVSPALGSLINDFAEWIGRNREFIGQEAGKAVEAVAVGIRAVAASLDQWLKGGGLKDLTTGISEVVQGIKSVVEWMGGWKTALLVVGGVLTANMLAPLTAVVAQLGLIAAFRVPVWLLGLLGLGGGVGAAVAGLGAGAYALHRLGRQRDNSPEKQEEQRQAFGQRGRLGGFYDGAAEDPGGPDAPGFLDMLRRLLPSFARGGGNATAPRGMPGPLDADMEPRLRAAAERHGVSLDFARQIARIEGGRRNGRDRTSSAGAIGQMQLMPGTARDLGVDPYNVDQNVDGGVRYLKQLLAKFGGNIYAAAAYNAGPNSEAVRRYAQSGDPRHLPAETQKYVGLLGQMNRPAAPAPVLSVPPVEPAQRQTDPDGIVRERSGSGPAQRQQPVPVDVRVRLEGPGTRGATVTTRTPDGVRVERSMADGFGS